MNFSRSFLPSVCVFRSQPQARSHTKDFYFLSVSLYHLMIETERCEVERLFVISTPTHNLNKTSWLYPSAQIQDKWMKYSSFRKKFMFSLMLVEGIDKRSGEDKKSTFRCLFSQSGLQTLAVLPMDTTCGTPVVLTTVWIDISLDILQKGQSFFRMHPPEWLKARTRKDYFVCLSGPHPYLLNAHLCQPLQSFK